MNGALGPRIVSLWDMVANLNMGAVVGLLEEISVLVKLSSHNKEIEAQNSSQALKADPKGMQAEEECIEAIGFVAKQARDLDQLLKSGHVQHAVSRLEDWTSDSGRKWSELFTRGCALREAIRIEFKEHLFFAYTRQRGQRLKDWATDWQKVLDAFPDVRADSYCATDCYCLEHYTASVFHSMRVAEIGLRALANERRIKLPKNKAIEWGNWQEIIRALDDEIKLIGQTWKACHRKDAALEFYSGARADLNGFKDEYRNLVMHVRKPYDEFQAARALARVHDFMVRLSQKLDHKNQRIKWKS